MWWPAKKSGGAVNKAVQNGLMTYPQELEDAEKLTKELRRLLARHEDTLEEENIRREVEILERWIAAYRRGVVNARRISPSEISLLGDLRSHLRLTLTERQRLEDEGGRAPTPEESEKLNELMKTMRRMERMLNLAQALHTMPLETEDA